MFAAACNDDSFAILERLGAIAPNSSCLLFCIYNRCFKFLFSNKLLAIIRLREALPDGLAGEDVENFEPEAILASHDMCNLCWSQFPTFSLEDKDVSEGGYDWARTMTVDDPNNVVKIESMQDRQGG
ncbi:hypothetical protein L195_g020655 [Trifolium pratense]|uniref:Uncharacterized protein n=1 Tax=Trifolium pratense TaxID=57577 RepID=A0A2K3N324_TRIPR|nr:hypothetical protein L195_g020655 [Trifolium pratense]